MKEFIIIVLLVALPRVHAQIRTSGDAEFMLVITDPARDAEIKGSPYFQGDKFYKGVVLIEGQNPMNLFLRYNVANELMEIKKEPKDKEIFRLPLNKRVVYEIDRRKFVFDKINIAGEPVSGFFIEYFQGDNIKFLGKPFATVSKEEKANSGYASHKPAEIKIDERHFIVISGLPPEEVRIRHKDIKRMFDDEESRDYLNENKIKSIEDFISFLQFYERSGNK